MGVDEYREASLVQWEGVATGWDHHADRLDTGVPGLSAEWLIEAAELGPGDEVLELACGPAGVGLRAAPRVGPEGRVLCTDFSPAMVEIAGRRAAEGGLANVEVGRLDAESMDLPDAGFDAVFCRFGYMLMGDPAAALAESRRVLRSGGRLTLAVWSEPGANPWLLSVVRPIMEHLDAPPPDPEAPGIFALADPERVRGLLVGAGFDDVRIERLEGFERFDSADQWWSYVTELAGPLAALLEAMSETDREQVRDAAYAAAEPYRDGEGLAFPSAVNVAAARRS